MRLTTFMIFLAVAIGAMPGELLAQSRFFTTERNIDRRGSDIDVLPAVGAADCSFACQARDQCRAFTFVRPGVIDPFGRCFLQKTVRAPIRDNCCTSGVRKAAPRKRN
jgi:hypothetical protein